MEAEWCLKNCWHAESTGHICLSSTIAVADELKNSCIITERRQIISITGHTEKQLSNTAILECKEVGGQRGSEAHENLSYLKLAELLVVAR